MSNKLPLERLSFDPAMVPLPASGTRARFRFPVNKEGNTKTYLCGHSLGLQPVGAGVELARQMERWADLGVEGHFQGTDAWLSYSDQLIPSLQSLVGARKEEIVVMNSLTVNLHLLLASFYVPHGHRTRILMESPSFPSDHYAIKSFMRLKGYDPNEHLLYWKMDEETGHFNMADLDGIFQRQGDEIALVLLGGVNYINGELLDMPAIVKLAHQYECMVGFDLAHAVGNVPLALHEWNVDFAVWCSYKYLNGGPGCIGGAFVHQSHFEDKRPRLEGWWGNDMENRFQMLDDFTPAPGAAAWSLSTPTSLALAPLKASLQLMNEVGIDNLRKASVHLTGYLEWLLQSIQSDQFRILTPSDKERRGAMLALHFESAATEIYEKLTAADIVVDYRRPDVIRVAPAPLYNNLEDIHHFVEVLKDCL